MRFEPKSYQREAALRMARTPHCALLADPGLGKTAITLAVLRWVKAQGPGERALVIAPRRVVYDVWPLEIEKWDQFKGITYSILHGPKKIKAVKEETDLHLVNFEGVQWLSKTKLFGRYSTLIVDESTKLKNWTSKRMLALKPHLVGFKRRHILTGSPIPRSLIDYFSQQYIVDIGAALGKAITPFRDEWFRDVSRDSNYAIWAPRRGAMEYVTERIKSTSIRLDGEVLLDLPTIQVNDIWSRLEKQKEYEKRAYDCDSEGVEFAVSRQLASGYLADGEVFHEQKLGMLVDLFESLQGKNLLVFFNFRHEGETIARRFNCPLVYGGTKDAEVGRIIRDWNAGEMPIVALNPATTGHGLNLQAGGHHMAWFSLPTKQEDYFQGIRRLRRQGQTASTVFVHRLLMRNTVDKRLVELIAEKTEALERFSEEVGRR